MFSIIPKALAQSTLYYGLLPIDFSSGSLEAIIQSVVNLILSVAGLVALVYLVFSGISYITAGGDAEKATSARTGIINAVIGVAVIIAALAIFNFVVRKIGFGI
ncbi:hypothetical protein HY373_00515 [Candidatus Berkelbacteria bacterium]|nr:hypothetical protein [Candidatus Berkelbacteria bacterium]MBI2588516.1 hypothetical protein [Candidatus Berkelbacteria bacterium]MBI4029648.1 hypothetical protein [Candidatus Berkelbacteria bacterium]